MLELYKNIKKRRKDLKLTQTELAELTGYTNKSSIASIEAGKIDLPQSKIMEFAKALKTTPSDLMGWEQEEAQAYEDAELLKKYHLLTEGQKQVVLELIDQFISN